MLRRHESMARLKIGTGMRNFHLPLPEETYAMLREAAARAQTPATVLAREAIDDWLRGQTRKARHDAIASYAAEMAGTDLDLDRDLEAAAVEHLRKTGWGPNEARRGLLGGPRPEIGLGADGTASGDCGVP